MAHRRARTPYHDEAYRLHVRLRDGDLEALGNFRDWHSKFADWSLAEIRRATVDKRITLETCQYAIAICEGFESFKSLVFAYWLEHAEPVRRAVESRLRLCAEGRGLWPGNERSRDSIRQRFFQNLYPSARGFVVYKDDEAVVEKPWCVVFQNPNPTSAIAVAPADVRGSEGNEPDLHAELIAQRVPVEVGRFACVRRIHKSLSPLLLTSDSVVVTRVSGRMSNTLEAEAHILQLEHYSTVLGALRQNVPLLAYMPQRSVVSRRNRVPWREFDAHRSVLLLDPIVCAYQNEMYATLLRDAPAPIPASALDFDGISDSFGVDAYVREKLARFGPGEVYYCGVYVDLLTLWCYLSVLFLVPREKLTQHWKLTKVGSCALTYPDPRGLTWLKTEGPSIWLGVDLARRALGLGPSSARRWCDLRFQLGREL